jgi:hypothetical protein
VDVGAAQGGGGDPDQRVERTDLRDGLVVQDDPAGLDEDRGLHPGRAGTPVRRRPARSRLRDVPMRRDLL